MNLDIANITTSPGASIGHHSETLPAKEQITLEQEGTEALLACIRGLSRAVCEQCGLRASYHETFSPKFGLDCHVQIRLVDEGRRANDDDWEHFFANDLDGLKRMRESLIAFIAAHRQQEEAA